MLCSRRSQRGQFARRIYHDLNFVNIATSRLLYIPLNQANMTGDMGLEVLTVIAAGAGVCGR